MIVAGANALIVSRSRWGRDEVSGVGRQGAYRLTSKSFRDSADKDKAESWYSRCMKQTNETVPYNETKSEGVRRSAPELREIFGRVVKCGSVEFEER